MGIRRGIAMAGKMLGAGEEALLLKGFYESRGTLCYGRGVVPEGAGVDDGILGIAVDVADRGEIKVEARGESQVGDLGGDVGDIFRVHPA